MTQLEYSTQLNFKSNGDVIKIYLDEDSISLILRPQLTKIKHFSGLSNKRIAFMIVFKYWF